MLQIIHHSCHFNTLWIEWNGDEFILKLILKNEFRLETLSNKRLNLGKLVPHFDSALSKSVWLITPPITLLLNFLFYFILEEVLYILSKEGRKKGKDWNMFRTHTPSFNSLSNIKSQKTKSKSSKVDDKLEVQPKTWTENQKENW